MILDMNIKDLSFKWIVVVTSMSYGSKLWNSSVSVECMTLCQRFFYIHGKVPSQRRRLVLYQILSVNRHNNIKKTYGATRLGTTQSLLGRNAMTGVKLQNKLRDRILRTG